MTICTSAEVKDAARIDGTALDTNITQAIAAAQSLIEHECGVDADAFNTAPDAGAKQCAIAIAVRLIDNPTAGKDEVADLLRSALLDRARTWA